jgi:hypothetical protein
MGKKADGNLAKELEDIDSTIAIGEDYVNKLYQMQEENATLGDLYSGSLDIDLASAKDQIKELKGVDKTIIDALNNRVNAVE